MLKIIDSISEISVLGRSRFQDGDIMRPSLFEVDRVDQRDDRIMSRERRNLRWVGVFDARRTCPGFRPFRRLWEWEMGVRWARCWRDFGF